MKYQVKKEFLLTANEGEMEMLAKAVSDQITALAKEYAGGVELWTYPNPAQHFIEVIAIEWFSLLSSLCAAIGSGNADEEYHMTRAIVPNIFEKEKEKREKEKKEAQEHFDKIF